MKRFSILYSGDDDSNVAARTPASNFRDNSGYDFKNVLADLNLREISKVSELEPKEIDYVLSVMTDFSSDEADIRLRNSVLEDFLSLPKFFDAFNGQIEYFENLREKLAAAKRTMIRTTSEVSAETSLLNYNKIVSACFFITLTYQTLFNLYREFKYFEVTSPRLVELKEFLIDLMEKSTFKKLCDECQIFSDHVNEGVVFDIEMKLNSILRIISLRLFDFRYAKPIESGLFFSIMRALSIEEKKGRNVKIYIEKTFTQESRISHTDDAYLKSVLEFQINLAARRIESIYTTLIDVFTNISQELVFYKYALGMIRYMKKRAIPYCTAEIVDTISDGQSFEFDELCDLSLINAFEESGKEAQVIPNDFNFEGFVNIVIGANQSGKTTFLRSFGCALMFARSGLPVPASRAKVDVFKTMYTHFQRYDADLKNEGQLDTELSEMAKIIYSASSRSVILMNESFSSTGIKDATQIACDMMGAFTHLKSRVVYVTHIPEIRDKLLSSGRSVSSSLYKTGQNADGSPTFKLEKM